jgi:FkbM family methyltransferase
MLSTVGYLSETRRYNHLSQLTVVPLALGAADHLAVQQLPTTRGMVDSTLGSIDGWLETLMTAKLDWLWPCISHDDPRIDGIKIDVQGMEIDVLLGMVDTLREHRPKLVIEIHRKVDRTIFLDIIETAGYCRLGIPIEPLPDETTARYYDDRSYAFERLE